MPTTGGMFQEVTAPHLPKAQQEDEQERRKAAKKVPCLDSLPSLGPVRGAACLCGLAVCAAGESGGSHLHLPATL